jgi:hypothetical protein
LTLQEKIEVVLAFVGALAVVSGPLGSALAALGTSFKVPLLVAIGERLAGFGNDWRKVVGGSRFTALKKELGTPADATVKEVAAQVKQDSVIPSRMFPSSPPPEKDPS